MARKRRKSQQQKQNRTLHTEKLEDRIVFSACAEVASEIHGALSFTGNNHLYVATDYDDQIVVDFTSGDAGTIKRTSTINGSPVVAPPVHFSYASLTAVAVPELNDPYLLIKGLKGDDTITINNNGHAPRLPFQLPNPQSYPQSDFVNHVTVYGGEGKDTIFGSGWADYLNGGPGKDEIWDGGNDGDGQVQLLLGGPGNDTLTGAPDGWEIICGGSGDDTIRTKGTDPTAVSYVLGGPGNDTIKGGSGYNEIYGGAGRDVIKGGPGYDYIFGGPGRDEIWGGSGNDIIYGGAAKDKIYGGDGKDEIFGGSGNDSIWGGAEDDIIEGGNGNDTLRGGAGTDSLYGQQGKDRLNGGSGIDYLYGGTERDQLWGGDDAVVDELWGQVGKDTFWQQTTLQDNLNDLQGGIDDLKWHTGNKEPWA